MAAKLAQIGNLDLPNIPGGESVYSKALDRGLALNFRKLLNAINALVGFVSALSTSVSGVVAQSSLANVQASNVAGQSVPNSVVTTVTGWTEAIDTPANNFNPTTGVFTAPATGVYRVDAAITWAAAIADTVAIAVQIVANSVVVAQKNAAGAGTSTGSTSEVACCCIVAMTAGQTLTVGAYQGTGGASSLTTAALLNSLTIQQIQ